MRTVSNKILAALLLAALVSFAAGCTGQSKTSESINDDEAVLQDCPPVDIVFVMDTSGSMGDEAAALCVEISGVEQRLRDLGLAEIRSTLLGITDRNVGDPDFACLTDTVLDMLGEDVPGNPFEGNEQLGSSEDWAPGSTIVADRFPWQAGAIRLVVPISDEGPENGGSSESSSCGEEDQAAANNLIFVANVHNVIVSPIIGFLDGQSACLWEDIAQRIADETGGTVKLTTDPETDLAQALFEIILEACRTFDGGGEPPPPANSAPTARAGADIVVATGARADLNAGGSSDPDGDQLTFSWTQTGGATVPLTGANTALASFTAGNSDEVLTFMVTVSDGRLQDTDTVQVTVQAPPPGLSYGTDINPIWQDRGCTACHGTLGGLTLSGSPQANYTAVTSGRVDSGTPANSLILTKPLGTNHTTVFTNTSDPDYQKILTWIQEGAKNN